MNSLRYILAGLILFIPTLLIAKLTASPYSFYDNENAVLKIAFQHAGQRIADFDETAFLREQGKKYREGMKVGTGGAKMDLHLLSGHGRERYSVDLRLNVNGKTELDKEFIPPGRKRDTVSVVYFSMNIEPGEHKIDIVMTDSKKKDSKPYLFNDTVTFAPSDVKIIIFDDKTDAIVWAKL